MSFEMKKKKLKNRTVIVGTVKCEACPFTQSIKYQGITTETFYPRIKTTMKTIFDSLGWNVKEGDKFLCSQHDDKKLKDWLS